MKKFAVITGLLISTVVTAGPAKADTVNMKDVDALAGIFCDAVANSSSLIPAFAQQYHYFGGFTSLEYTATAKQMAIVTNYAVTEVCPQLKTKAATEVQSLYDWLTQKINSGELERIHPDVKSEMLVIAQLWRFSRFKAQ